VCGYGDKEEGKAPFLVGVNHNFVSDVDGCGSNLVVFGRTLVAVIGLYTLAKQ
jgi:hypothetical protein